MWHSIVVRQDHRLTCYTSYVSVSPPGCLQIFLLLTLPRLNFSSLVLNSNFLR